MGSAVSSPSGPVGSGVKPGFVARGVQFTPVFGLGIMTSLSFKQAKIYFFLCLLHEAKHDTEGSFRGEVPEAKRLCTSLLFIDGQEVRVSVTELVIKL